MTPRGWALFSAMCVIWGIPYLLIKVALDDLQPATLVFFRTAAGALLLLPLAARPAIIRALLDHWRAVLVYTTVEVGIPWLLLSDAERRLSSSLAGLLVAAVPLIGAVLAWATGSADRLDARRIGGLLIGIAGVAVVLGFNVSGGDARAVGEVGVVAFGYALGPMVVVRQLRDVPAMGVVTASLGLTAVFYAPIALTHLPATAPSLRVMLAVATLSVVCTALAFLVFFSLIATVGPVRATVITYFNPAVALALGVLVLHEPLTAGLIAGFALILAGSILATRRNRATPPVQDARHPAGVAGTQTGHRRDADAPS